MEILLRRIVASDEATIGLLFIDGKPECWTLEDQFQAKKVFGETRIPCGRYHLIPREKGGMYNRYHNQKWPRWHRGMIEVKDVPGFTDILLHVGNKDDDTYGCVLVGRKGVLVGRYTVEESQVAYTALYPKVIDSVYEGTCRLTVVDDESLPGGEEPAQPEDEGSHNLLSMRKRLLANVNYSDIMRTAVAELLKRVDMLEKKTV